MEITAQQPLTTAGADSIQTASDKGYSVQRFVGRLSSVTLINADWRDVKLDGDVLITDPPYGTENGVGYGRSQNYGGKGRKIENDASIDEMLALLEAAPQMRASIFASPRNQLEVWNGINAMGWTVAAWLVWNKTVPGLGSPIQYQHELVALLNRNGEKNDKNVISVLDYYPESRQKSAECHPHQKPLALMQKLVGLYDAKTIIDPFMGSGTTGLACLKAGVNFIGVEKDKRYFEIGCERISREIAQGQLICEINQGVLI